MQAISRSWIWQGDPRAALQDLGKSLQDEAVAREAAPSPRPIDATGELAERHIEASVTSLRRALELRRCRSRALDGMAMSGHRTPGQDRDLPLLDDALRRGEISYSKLRALTRVATPETEAALLEIARRCPGHELETVCRKYRSVLLHDAASEPDGDRQRRWVARRDTADGMVRIEAVLHPEEAALVWAALDHGAQQQCRESHRVSAETSRSAPTAAPDAPDDDARAARSVASFDRADALVELAQGYLRGDRPDRSPIELVVSVPAETLRRPLAVTTDAVTATEAPDPCDVACLADGTAISAEAVRRLSCDCGVVDAIEDQQGVPLSVGRKRRTIPGSMKRALLQRDRTCRFPGCANRLYLEAHHVVHWADGGDTSLRNVVACCSFHHRYVHEYGCSIELHDDGPHFLDRRGRRILDAPPPSRPPDLGWETLLARNAELQITASTNEPLWDGARVDRGAVIDAVLGADRAEAIRGWS